MAASRWSQVMSVFRWIFTRAGRRVGLAHVVLTRLPRQEKLGTTRLHAVKDLLLARPPELRGRTGISERLPAHCAWAATDAIHTGHTSTAWVLVILDLRPGTGTNARSPSFGSSFSLNAFSASAHSRPKALVAARQILVDVFFCAHAQQHLPLISAGSAPAEVDAAVDPSHLR